MAEFMRRGYSHGIFVRMRKLYRDRLAAMEEALEKHMPDGTSWTHPEGGMSLWATLPSGFDAGELLIHARERGILFLPGRYFHRKQPRPNTLRLGLRPSMRSASHRELRSSPGCSSLSFASGSVAFETNSRSSRDDLTIRSGCC